MSADIVNLRRVRKNKERAGKATEAAANRVLFGRTRATREAETIEKTRADCRLDAHKLEGQGPDEQRPELQRSELQRPDLGDGDAS